MNVLGEVFKTSNTRLVDKVIRSISLNVDEANKLADIIHKKDLGVKEIRYCDRTSESNPEPIEIAGGILTTYDGISWIEKDIVIVYKEYFNSNFNVYEEISKLGIEDKVTIIEKITGMGDLVENEIYNFLWSIEENIEGNK